MCTAAGPPVPVAVYKVVRPGVHEEVIFTVHDVARLHIRSTHRCYQMPLLYKRPHSGSLATTTASRACGKYTPDLEAGDSRHGSSGVAQSYVYVTSLASHTIDTSPASRCIVGKAQHRVLRAMFPEYAREYTGLLSPKARRSTIFENYQKSVHRKFGQTGSSELRV